MGSCGDPPGPLSPAWAKVGSVAVEKQYQSLYRKYRPQGPQDVLGQEHVVRALMGGVNEGRLAHAFLFCGPRGTGKTSTARILAKMVNCEKGPTAEPCGDCEQCQAIREGGHLDVVEIDAASHGGVEDARELREKAPTAPVVGREKVYIIDEAQRLTQPAFDALLKVLEEPPPGVRFVFATTEPQKMPATIIGRCQRFDFRRVPQEALSAHLQRIATEEDVKLAPEAADAISRHSEGSVRDALSLLDQASLLGGGSVGMDELASLLGAPQSVVQDEIADALAIGDARAIFETVNRLVQDGQDLRHTTAEALQHFRNLLIAHAAPDQSDLLDVTSDEHDRLRAQAQKFTATELSRVISLLLAAQSDMRWTTSPRITLELALIRAAMPETDPAPASLISRIERLERRSGIDPGVAEASPEEVSGSLAASSAQPQRERTASPTKADASAAQPQRGGATSAPRSVKKDVAASAPIPVATGDIDIDTFRRSWPTVVQHLRASRQMILATNLESVTPSAFDGQTLELMFPPDRKFGIKKVEDRQKDLQDALQELFGVAPSITCLTRDGGPAGAEDEDEGPLSEEEALARVQAALGAQIAPEIEGS